MSSTTYTVKARHGNGPWVIKGSYRHAAHAKRACYLNTGGKWVAKVFETPDAPIPTSPERTGNPNAYGAIGVPVYFFLPTGETYQLKNGEEREKMMRITLRKIHIKCLRSGQEWHYTGIKRGGAYRYSDSRKQDMADRGGSMPEDKFKDELYRMMGDVSHEVFTQLEDPERMMKKSDYDDAFGRKII
jgi:hypothetical protein